MTPDVLANFVSPLNQLMHPARFTKHTTQFIFFYIFFRYISNIQGGDDPTKVLQHLSSFSLTNNVCNTVIQLKKKY